MIYLFLTNAFPFALNICIIYFLSSLFIMDVHERISLMPYLNAVFEYFRFETKPHLNYCQMIKPFKYKNVNPIKADWHCCVWNPNSVEKSAYYACKLLVNISTVWVTIDGISNEKIIKDFRKDYFFISNSISRDSDRHFGGSTDRVMSGPSLD